MSGQSWIHKQRKQAVHVQTDSSFLQDRAVIARRSRSAEVNRGHESPDLVSESRSSGDRSRGDFKVRYVAGELDVRSVSTPSVIIIGLGGPSSDSVSHTHAQSNPSNEAQVHVTHTQSSGLPGEHSTHTHSSFSPGDLVTHTHASDPSNINQIDYIASRSRTVIIDNDRGHGNCDTRYQCHCHQRRQCYHKCQCHRGRQCQQESCQCQCQERRWHRDSGSSLGEEGSMRQPRAITGYRGCQSGLHGTDHRRGELVRRVTARHKGAENCTRTSHPRHRCTANCTRTSHPRHRCTSSCTGSVHPRHRCTVDCTRLSHHGRLTRSGRVTKPGKVCTSTRLKVKVSKQGRRGGGGGNTF